MFTRVKTPQEIKHMRESGRMLATILRHIEQKVEAGMSGYDIAEMAKKDLKAYGARASFLGYMGFPDVICVSVNDAVVHGIPDNIPFKEGDIVGFDFGVTFGGMITDSALSVCIGNKPNKVQKNLLEATERAMYAGIQTVKHGVKTGDIGAAVQKILDASRLGIVRDLVGHGVGHAVHEEPNVPNYGPAGSGHVLKAGMTIAIEPMATLGKHQVFIDNDGWTVRTSDATLSAHFEHTVLITPDGFEILTER